VTSIAAIDVIPYSLPFREPYVTSRGRLERRDLIMFRVRTEDGVEGLGETAPLILRGGAGLEAIVSDLEDRCLPALGRVVPDAAGIAEAVERCRLAGVSAQALCAVDLALHDLAGKLREEPVWKLLGETEASPVRCNATLSAGDPAAVARAAEAWAERGFDTFKLKLGAVSGDAEQVAATRAAVGTDARVRIDANAAWDLEEAVAVLGEIERHEIELAEQPVAELDGLAKLRGRTRIPIAADESVATTQEARRAVSANACDAATVKLAKCGGIAAALAVARELPVYLSSALDGPVGIAAAAHTAQALPATGFAAGLAHGLATAELFDGTIAAVGPELDGPLLRPGDAPGLGVEIDPALLRRHRL
jgi:L-alanine-DL-glutamate epimerase-like enolase superfamily enzyme